MFFTLEVLPARKGDCLLLHFGTPQAPHLVMIDGGPAKVYKPFLRKRLLSLKGVRGDGPLAVDMLMVSHIDDDHIKGVLEFAEELEDETRQQKVPFARVKSFWHNTFDDLLKTTPDQLASVGFGAAGAGPQASFFGPESSPVLASVNQGRQLRDSASFLKWKNREVKTPLIMASDKPEKVKVADILDLTISGPMKEELEELQKAHDKWLKEKKANTDAAAALAAYLDKSIPNLSSVVVLAEAGGKSMLLTGDARGDKILEGLELAGLLEEDGVLEVDILKAPHHGSDHNVELPFFERIQAEHYVFSGNGEHGNPERATIEMLLEATGDRPITMHFTYDIAEIDKVRKSESANWKPQRDALQPLLDNLPAHKTVSVVEQGTPHLIDLLDACPYQDLY